MGEEEISLWDLWHIIKKHAVKVINFTAMGAVLAVAFMLLFVTPQYNSRAQLIVNQQGMSQGEIQLGDVQTSVHLINTYRDIITGDSVLAEVNENMGNAYTIGGLREAISVQQSTNSQAFNITVTMESPTEAQNVLNNIISIFEETVNAVYGEAVRNIYVLSPATYNPNQVSPSFPLYLIIGAMLGLMVSWAYIFIIEISDTTVKDDDFMTSLGFVNLGHVNELSSKEVKQSRFTLGNGQRKRGDQ